jgi:hypothetical protein
MKNAIFAENRQNSKNSDHSIDPSSDSEFVSWFPFSFRLFNFPPQFFPKEK